MNMQQEYCLMTKFYNKLEKTLEEKGNFGTILLKINLQNKSDLMIT